MSRTRTPKWWLSATAVLSAGLLITGCLNNDPEAVADDDDDNGAADTAPAGDNAEPGEDVVIGFSGPNAGHGWMGAITAAAQEQGEQFEDVELRVSEGTDDVNLQISQIEQFINDDVDAIVVLPFDGAALTEVAIEAMEAGIPVVNVDREFSSPFAARTTILGDNYGMGVSAGEYICERLEGQEDAVVAEIAGIDSLPLTQDRSAGFEDALSDCGLEVSNRVDGGFSVASGEEAASNLLQAAPEIDAIWNHDDDQGVGVLAAIENAGRDEFFMVGGAGSANMMREIQDADSVVEATVIYPSTEELTVEGVFDPVSFSIRPGEIVGLAGLVGAGRSEILEAVYGARRRSSGAVKVNGRPLRAGSVTHAVNNGIGLAPEERKSQGLLLDQPIYRNITLSTFARFARGILLNESAERAAARQKAEALNLSPPNVDRSIRTLSGGNQQKAMLARWLVHGCQVLLLDEPTRGVDVGARADIYNLIRELASQGTAVLLVSSEIEEVLGLADRVLVVADGAVMHQGPAAEIDEHRVLDLVMEGTPV